MSSIFEVTWKVGQKEIEFESAADIIAAEEGGRIEFNETGIVLNTPQIIWPDGQKQQLKNVPANKHMMITYKE